MMHNMQIFIVKLSNSLLRRILVIVIIEWSGNLFKNECTLTILRIANGGSVEEFHLIILRLKFLIAVTKNFVAIRRNFDSAS